MSEKKRKNGLPNHIERNLLIVTMIFGVLVLIWAFFIYIIPGCGCSPSTPHDSGTTLDERLAPTLDVESFATQLTSTP